MKDGEMQKLVGKIHLIGDDEHEADFEKTGYNVSTVEMYLKDGRVLRKKVTCHKGQHENPMTEEELRDKFRGCALKVLSKDLTENIIEAVDRLETLDNISKITKLLHK